MDVKESMCITGWRKSVCWQTYGVYMLNEEKIRLMTRMAAYEQGDGKEDMLIKQYYRTDYVSYQMIKTFISSTIAFGILFLLGTLYSMESLVHELVQMDFMELGRMVLIRYAVFVILYQIVAFVVYNMRYRKATRRMKEYYSELKKVSKLQEGEEKAELTEEWE